MSLWAALADALEYMPTVRGNAIGCDGDGDVQSRRSWPAGG